MNSREEAIIVALNDTAIVAETDINGVITYVNDKFVAISKYEPEELLGKTHALLNSGYHSKRFMKDLWTTIKSGKVWRGEIQNRAKDGSMYWVDTAISPIFNEQGDVERFIAIRFDLTKRKELAKQLEVETQAHQESLTVLGQLASTVAHEINNPLAAISMFTQMMEGELTDDSPFHEHIDVIKRNTESCKKTVQILLNHAHRSQPETKELNLNEILNEITIFFKPMCIKNDAIFEINLEASITKVIGDPVQLRQVFLNLLMNALQCHKDVNGTVCLRSKNSEDQKKIIVEVEDNGPGVTEEFKERIFEPFFTTKELGKGTGLGLSISLRVVNAHHGELKLIESEKGKTIFRVELPVFKG